MSEFWKTILITVIGGSGLIGLLFYYFRRYIDGKLAKSEKDAEKKRELNLKRAIIDDELSKAQCSVIFWMHEKVTGNTGVESSDKNLEDAFKKMREAEDKKKALDREIISQYGG